MLVSQQMQLTFYHVVVIAKVPHDHYKNAARTVRPDRNVRPSVVCPVYSSQSASPIILTFSPATKFLHQWMWRDMLIKYKRDRLDNEFLINHVSETITVSIE